MVDLVPKQRVSIPILRRFLKLRRYAAQIDRPREKLAFVMASILEEVWGRRDIYPDLVINLKGRRFFCRKGTSDYLHVFYDFEPETTELLSGQQGNVFMDVGAHIGRYTVLLAGSFQKVVAAEPLGETFRVLSGNVQNNHLRNIVLVNEALEEKEGHGELYIHENLGECSLIHLSECRIEVPLTNGGLMPVYVWPFYTVTMLGWVWVVARYRRVLFPRFSR